MRFQNAVKTSLIFAIMGSQNAQASYQEDSWEKNKVLIHHDLLDEETEYRRTAREGSTLPTLLLQPNVSEIMQRRSQFMDFRFDHNPQAVFFFRWQGHVVMGRKYLSDLVVERGLPGLFCSAVKADMILGLFERDRISALGVRAYYHPLAAQEKSAIFAALLDNRQAELWYPYTPLAGEARLEKSTPDEGWVADKERAEFLGMGEEEIRAYTIRVLADLGVKKSLNGLRIYDPACSTGQFLSHIKTHFPEVYTIGQELSASMVDFARDRVDEIHHGNSIEPKVAPASVDIVFFRFLNGEVVTTQQAEELFASIKKVVKNEGYIVLFGHTPVLLDSIWLENTFDLKPIQLNGVSEAKDSVFQYMIFQARS